jgi:cytochrome bd-type quinol oxidase subunit 2
MARSAPTAKSPVRRAVIAVLLLAAIGGTLWVPIYARFAPKLGDFPFFYWYQLILVPVVAILCWLCSVLLRARPTPAARHRNGGGLRK